MLENNCYYVDKTSFIKEIVGSSNYVFDVNLIMRPRRFGKTINQTMLRCFFDPKEAECKPLFDGLEINKDKEFCDKYQNKVPVIFLSFKSLDTDSLEKMLLKLNTCLSNEFERHLEAVNYLTNVADKNQFNRIFEKEASFNDIEESLALFLQYKVNPIILIDEYDVPLDWSFRCGYFEQFISTFRSMFHNGLKGNKYCKGAVITGCLQIAKNQLYTGFNNPLINNVSSCNNHATAFGFTAKEVHDMLVYYNLEYKEPQIKDWYDGYRFNDVEIYNPFSVSNQINGFNTNPNAILENYWANTSGVAVLKQMLDSCANDVSLRSKFEELLNGYSIDTEFSTTMTYDDMLNNEAAIFGTLLFTGYLTLNEKRELYIPNKEVLSTFNDIVKEYNNEKLKIEKPKLFSALSQKDEFEVASIIRKLIRNSFSYYNLSTEAFAHGFLVGVFSQVPEELEWYIENEREFGLGRFDIALVCDPERLAIIIEVKKANSDENPDDKLEEGVKQIVINRYRDYFVTRKYKVLGYSICFFSKNVQVKLVTDEDRKKYLSL